MPETITATDLDTTAAQDLSRTIYALAYGALALTLVLCFLFKDLGIYSWNWDPIMFMALIAPIVIVSGLVLIFKKLPLPIVIMLAAAAIISNSVFCGYMVSTYALTRIAIALGVATAILIGLNLSPGMQDQKLTKPAIGAVVVLGVLLVALYLNIELAFDEDSFALAAVAVATTLVLMLHNIKLIKLGIDTEHSGASTIITRSLLIYLLMMYVFIAVLFVNGHN